MTLKTKLAALAIIAGTALTTPAFAAEIAVVDTNLVAEKATAVTKIREQVEKKAEEYQKDSSKKEEYFKKKYEDLEKQKATLSKEAYEKKNNDLGQEFNEAQKKVQETRSSLDKAYVDAMRSFDKVFTEVVQEEAKKAGAKAVLQKTQTIYVDETLDITNKVIEAVNKKQPSASVKF